MGQGISKVLHRGEAGPVVTAGETPLEHMMGSCLAGDISSQFLFSFFLSFLK
jgi:hypothetical protein